MDESSLPLNLAALAFSVLAIITSTTIALRQSRLMHHANLLPILTEIFDEFRASEFKQHMAYVTGELWRQHPPGAIGFDDLSDSARRHAGTVTSYYNTVGILVANRIISDLLVASYMGRSILQAWRHLEPYIRSERRLRDDDSWNLFFENLAAVTAENPPSRIDARLRLKRMSASTAWGRDA
ncbi:MAG TPA: hypothetical protein VGR68_07120 [Actinomycetota bacterium]|nr:hypothetical protein [Actinomycetota bacterium]